MRICGIIAEYNPFHNGHEKHILLSREKTGADLIVCVMSGSFVQRGQPAIFDKWTRAACAVKCGADAVLELPLLYSLQSAEGFAAGGAALLNVIGAHDISFGCETDDLQMLSSIAKKLSRETRAFRRSLKEYLEQGLSFPDARSKAAFPDAPPQAGMPNSILAIEYLKAINRQRSKLVPCAVKRIGEAYHSVDTSTLFSSATAIRRAFADNNLETAYNSMPKAAKEYISLQLSNGLIPVSPACFDKELLYRLRLGGTAYIKTLHEVTEGLENRIFEAAKVCNTTEELIDKIKTKRYTYTRISRILAYALLGITRDMVKKHNRRKISHARVLGVKNPEVLSVLSKTCRVPIITGAASSPYSPVDIASTDIYALSQKTAPFNSASRDFTQKLFIEEKNE